jgi:hypothetical protein
MCQCIYVEGKSDVFLSSFEDVLSSRNACVVDEDRRLTNILPNLRCYGREGGRGSDVTFIIIDMFCYNSS